MLTETPVAELLFPGAFFNEDEVIDLPALDVNQVPIKPGCFAFRLGIHKSQTAILDDGREIPHSEITWNPGRYYLGGTIYTLDEIEAMDESHGTLATNMRSNNWLRVVKTRMGNFQPFTDADFHLAEVK
ncbi:MAG: hypothetical protein IMZ62_13010 [Chloroflexi bacterium]|nr:hypothetical protein [Chloroflexota bacterium]MBE3118198.1 hypothetical protein [Candidatus Atribacteria bacterium]